MNRVRVRVPTEATLLVGPSGDTVIVKIDDAGRYADLLETDVQMMIFNGLPASVPWRELNPDLVDRLRPATRTRIPLAADLHHAAEMSAATNPFDRAAIVRQTLAMIRSSR